MRALLVEADFNLGKNIQQGLCDMGLEVDVSCHGPEGRTLALSGAYDLLILDIQQPGLGGFAILDAVRKTSDVPVLLLSAHGDFDDDSPGGATCEYLNKPFVFHELALRLGTILSKTTPQDTYSYRVGDLTVDTVSHLATRSGNFIELTRKEFALLELLARRAGRIVSSATLAEQVWGVALSGDKKAVDASVQRLRTKLDAPYGSQLIHDVPGMGYVLEDRALHRIPSVEPGRGAQRYLC